MPLLHSLRIAAVIGAAALAASPVAAADAFDACTVFTQ